MARRIRPFERSQCVDPDAGASVSRAFATNQTAPVDTQSEGGFAHGAPVSRSAPMSSAPQRRLFAPHALLPTGWERDVTMTWDDAGTLTQVQTRTAADADVLRAAGVVIPGMPNLHSHAFQRAFAGLAEYRSGNGDLTG